MGTVVFTENGTQKITVEIPVKEIDSEVLRAYPRIALAKMLEDKKAVIIKMLRARTEAMTNCYAEACFAGKYIGSMGGVHYYMHHNQVCSYSPDLVESICGTILELQDGHFNNVVQTLEALRQIRASLYWTNEEDRKPVEGEKYCFSNLLLTLEAYA